MDEALRKLVTELDAKIQTLRIVCRVMLQRQALASGDPRRYAADIFSGVMALPDRMDETPPGAPLCRRAARSHPPIHRSARR